MFTKKYFGLQRFVLIISFFTALLPLSLFAGPDMSGMLPDITVMNVENGLSSNQTNGIIFDQQGFLWIYTVNGLNRFDGYNFQVYTSTEDPDTIGGNNIQSAVLDADGRLWTGGITLNRYEPEIKKFTRYDITDAQTIKAITVDTDDTVWIGGDDFGLIEFDPEKEETAAVYIYDKNRPDSLRDNRIRDIESDGRGTLWIATESGIIEEFDIRGKKFIHHEPGGTLEAVDGLAVRDIEIDRDGKIWASTPGGLIRYNPHTGLWKLYRHEKGNPGSLPTDDIWGLLEDREGTLWIGTDKKGLSMLLPGGETFYSFDSGTAPYTIPPGAIFNITESFDGALWISVYNYGISRFSLKDRKFRHYTARPQPDGLSFNNILDLHEDTQGIVWIATDGGGLNSFNPDTGKFRHFIHQENSDNTISTDSVISIAEGPPGTLWFGTWEGGLNKFDIETERFTHYTAQPDEPGKLPSNSLFTMTYDSEGVLWISVWDRGVFRFEPDTETFTDFHSENGDGDFSIEGRYINFIRKEENGLMYIGGHGSLDIVYPDNRVENLSLTRSDEFYDMYRDKSGTVWFATSEGLIEYHHADGSIAVYGTGEGLPGDMVVSIQADNSGILWLGTHKGLCSFDPGSKEVVRYDVSDGLQGLEFNRYSSLKTADGELYFGGSNGLNRFDPRDITKSVSIPEIYITDLEIFQQEASIGEEDSFLDKDISYSEKIILPYAQRDFSFEMVMLNYRFPEKNRYRYILDGYDKEWIEVEAHQRHVRYTNLKPGEYRFRYQGRNSDGTAQTDEKSLEIRILRPWWMKLPALMIFALFIGLFIYLIILVRFRVMMRRQKELEKQVEEKSSQLKSALKELEDANSSLENQVRERTAKLTEEITERKVTQKRLLHMVTHDPLTGLTNRAWLTDKLDELMERVHADPGFTFLMILIDGDEFKIINDSYGHITGDKLLVSVAQRLQRNMPRNAWVSRHGGDEFIILVENIDSPGEGKKLAEKVRDSFIPPFFIDYKSISFGFSMGIVLSSPHYIDGDDMLRDADIALYRAKADGSRCYRFFDNDMKKKIQEDVRIMTGLKKALEKEEFNLLYQPLLTIADGQLCGFEALIRCNNQEWQNIGPDKFIPIAEESGLINDIGLWTIREACSQIAEWSKRFPLNENNIVCSLNLSPKQLLSAELLENIEGIFKAHSTFHGSIKFEITETALMENPVRAKEILYCMVDKGISLAIDDFGTGYSSLSYLHTLPFEFLKIDRSFVSGMDKDREAFEIVKSTISLAQALQMKTIAEGVETESQLKILDSFGCEFAQGYLFDKPLTPEETEIKWLSRLSSPKK